MKVIRYAIYAVIALLLLAVAAVAIAVAVINPNDYKPQIEAAVEKQTNLDLMLEMKTCSKMPFMLFVQVQQQQRPRKLTLFP